VIVPAYNAYVPLSNTLAALALQLEEGPALETIVVDNNSTARSPEMLHRRFRRALSMTLVHQPALPHPFAISRARNTGMRLTDAAWILLLDADCIPGPGCLAAVREAIAGCHGSRLIATGERIFIDPLSCGEVSTAYDLRLLMDRPRIASDSNYGLTHDRRLPDMLALTKCPHPWAYMHAGVLLYSAAAAREVGGFDESYDGRWGYEDADFAYRMIVDAGCAPRYVEGMKVLHQEGIGEANAQRYKWNKRANPNWHRICATIPGFEQFKREQWESLGVEVIL